MADIHFADLQGRNLRGPSLNNEPADLRLVGGRAARMAVAYGTEREPLPKRAIWLKPETQPSPLRHNVELRHAAALQIRFGAGRSRVEVCLQFAKDGVSADSASGGNHGGVASNPCHGVRVASAHLA